MDMIVDPQYTARVDEGVAFHVSRLHPTWEIHEEDSTDRDVTDLRWVASVRSLETAMLIADFLADTIYYGVETLDDE